MAPTTAPNNVLHHTAHEGKFHDLLRDQIHNEFTASQQYLAIAVWFDDQTLPQLASFFYRQAIEERNHALMIVQYFLDIGHPVTIPGIGDVRNDFTAAREPIELALTQERKVTDEIIILVNVARAENDYLGEQFLQWFLKEQIEEVSSMSNLLTIVGRAGEVLFHVEDYLAREKAARPETDPVIPRVAGGAL